MAAQWETGRFTMLTILKEAWRIYRQNFALIAGIVVVIWTPLELLSSYMDYFVFGEDDFRKSFRFAMLLENFFGIIATAGVISATRTAVLSQRPMFWNSIGIGFRAWGRMWWTRFLSGFALVLGFVLLIIPGVYLLVRLALVEQVAVLERTSGYAAMKRSFELTEARFWLVFRLGFVLLLLFALPLVIIVLPSTIFPALDHWLFDAATTLVADVVWAFATVALVSAYGNFSSRENTTLELE